MYPLFVHVWQTRRRYAWRTYFGQAHLEILSRLSESRWAKSHTQWLGQMSDAAPQQLSRDRGIELRDREVIFEPLKVHCAV